MGHLPNSNFGGIVHPRSPPLGGSNVARDLICQHYGLYWRLSRRGRLIEKPPIRSISQPVYSVLIWRYTNTQFDNLCTTKLCPF